MGIASGELARRAGVSPDTLRHYERVGVLPKPARSANNYRLYPEAALERVRLVRRALAFGFTLAELAAVLRERDRGARPCRRVRALAEQKLESLERRLEELARLRDDLRVLLRDWGRVLDAAPLGAPARLLDSLPPRTDVPTPQENHDEPDHAPSRRRPDARSGRWSPASAADRTPPPGRKGRRRRDGLLP